METAPAPLQHLLISASAGSGKTWQLVRRHLHLLALGVSPEDIAAMTFTRKAAGEFFNRILRQLAELAVKPGAAADYFKDCSPPLAHEADFPGVLRRVTRRMHRLRLGTLDSFFASVTTCFPLELGLGSTARVMDEKETELAARAALASLLEKLHREENAASMSQLMEAHKQATFGAEEKSADESLMDLTRKWLALWEESSGSNDSLRGWGDVSLPGMSTPLTPVSDLIAKVRAHFIPPEKGAALLDETLAEALETVPCLSLPKRVRELLAKLAEVWDDLPAGRAVIVWNRARLELSTQAGKALSELAEGIIARELHGRARRTRGIARIIGLYAEEYAAQVRQRGRLSFADVQRLLARAAVEKSPWLGGGGDLWFRLDARHAHWMLDEFQDTSRKQWQIVSNLVDEVIQDHGGRRSFFAVGDPKQSIYLWREAEPGLFDDILALYPARAGGGLHQMPLSMSWRSAQPVLDMVNRVFGSRTLIEELLPAGCMDGFAFQAHEAAKKDLAGHAALLSTPVVEKGAEQEALAGAAAGLLRGVDPLGRGLTCAILTRQNNEAAALAETLRALTGMDIVCEAETRPCTDNAATLALLSLLSLAAHPGDTAALEHLRMTPLWPLIESGGEGWKLTALKTLALVQARGFAGFMEQWTPRLRGHLPELDAFHLRRLGQMADIAAEYDAGEGRCVDGFLRFAREYPMRARGPARSIQVMTIHAAKGLEFDLVIQMAHDARSMRHVRDDKLLACREQGTVRWVLEAPPRACGRLVPELDSLLQEAEKRAAFEALCRLYVAMTRAIHGLYIIAKPAPKKGESVNEGRLLRETLGSTPPRGHAQEYVIEWETGDPDWFRRRQPAAKPAVAATPPPAAPLGHLLRETQPIPRRRTPSGEETFRVKGSVLFSPGREPGRRLGTLVHELLAGVEWRPDLRALESRWLSQGLLTPDDLAGGADAVAKEIGRAHV